MVNFGPRAARKFKKVGPYLAVSIRSYSNTPERHFPLGLGGGQAEAALLKCPPDGPKLRTVKSPPPPHGPLSPTGS
jgi:hypothetical protein